MNRVNDNVEKIENPLLGKVKNFCLKMHLNLSNCGIRVDSGIIDWEGNCLHGKTICREVFTKKTKMRGWGKCEVTYYIDGDKEEHPSFKTIDELIDYYKKSNPLFIKQQP